MIFLKNVRRLCLLNRDGFNRYAVHAVAVAAHDASINTIRERSNGSIAHNSLEKRRMRRSKKLGRAILEKRLFISSWHTIRCAAGIRTVTINDWRHIGIRCKNVRTIGLTLESGSPADVIPVEANISRVIIAAVGTV